MGSLRVTPDSMLRASLKFARRRYALAVALVLVAATLGTMVGARYWARSQAGAVSSPKASNGTFHLTDQQLRSVATEPVVTMKFHSEELTDGKIAFNGDTLTQVYSPYSGRVTRVIAAPGAVVKRGEPLFELEASEYAQGEADLLTALAQFRFSTLNEARKHAAFDAHGAALQEWQQAQSDLAVAGANLSVARNRLHILGLADERIDAIGKLGRADALVPVRTPIAGLVVDRQLGPGQVLQAGGPTALYTIADLSTVWLVANVREADVPRVRVGQTITARVLALPGREFRGRVNYVGAAVDPTSRRVAVRAVIDGSKGALKPEMFASVAIATSADSESPAIPRDAVLYEGDAAHVWVMLSDHEVGLRAIRIGRERDGKLEVLEGLTTGQRVVTRGALFIDRAGSAG